VQRRPLNQLSNPNRPATTPQPLILTPSPNSTQLHHSHLSIFLILHRRSLKDSSLDEFISNSTGPIQQNVGPKALHPHDPRIPRAIRDKIPCIAFSHSAFRCSAFYGDINDVPFFLTSFISLLSLFISLASPTTRTVGDAHKFKIAIHPRSSSSSSI
jgi:hypothetical protein